MMSGPAFVMTRSGEPFFSGDPESYIPELESVARTLARIPRFNGHSDSAYSVLHHSIAGAMALEDMDLTDAAALFLVHDAHESILGDIPSPVKPLIPGLAEYERRLENHFTAIFAGPAIMSDQARAYAHAIDRVIVAIEADAFGLGGEWSKDRLAEYIATESAGPVLPHAHHIKAHVQHCCYLKAGEAVREFLKTAERLGIS